jgi:hypothetical protein
MAIIECEDGKDENSMKRQAIIQVSVQHITALPVPREQRSM